MEKIVKSYLMLYRTHTFVCCVVIGIVSFMLTFAIAIAIDLPERFDNVVLVFASTCLVIAITILTAISLAAKKRITMPVNELSEGRPYNLFEVLVFEDGKRVILDRPIWGKGKVYLIKQPTQSYIDGQMIAVSSRLSIKHRCITVSIPVTLTFMFSQPFDKLELFELLLKWQPGNDLDIEKHLNIAFSQANLDNQAMFDQLADEYFRKTITCAEFICTLTNSLVLPKDALPKVTSVTAYLEEPIISSSKHVS